MSKSKLERIGWLPDQPARIMRRRTPGASTTWYVQWDNGQRSHMGTAPTTLADQFAEETLLRRIVNEMKRRDPSPGPNGTPGTTELCTLSIEFASLFQFLTDTKYDDGSARQPGSITLFSASEGGLRVCLNDKDADEVAFVSASTLSELLTRTNYALSENQLDWRRGQRGGKRPRK